jgi:hypothetical protein
MKSRFYVSFGVWIAILPFLGIPGAWKNALVTLSGLFLVLVSLGPTILKKLQSKPKQRRKKESPPTQNPDINKEELKFSGNSPENILPPTFTSL